MDILKNIAVLYSFEQKCFHLEYLHEYLESNINSTINKKDHQYRMIALENNWDDANNLCDNLQKKYPEVFL